MTPADLTEVAFDLCSYMLQVLEEFYCNLKTVGVSAVTGESIDDFFTSVQTCAEEYLQFYKPELDRKVQVWLKQLHSKAMLQLVLTSVLQHLHSEALLLYGSDSAILPQSNIGLLCPSVALLKVVCNWCIAEDHHLNADAQCCWHYVGTQRA